MSETYLFMDCFGFFYTSPEITPGDLESFEQGDLDIIKATDPNNLRYMEHSGHWVPVPTKPIISEEFEL
jgi:hypothetical protein